MLISVAKVYRRVVAVAAETQSHDRVRRDAIESLVGVLVGFLIFWIAAVVSAWRPGASVGVGLGLWYLPMLVVAGGCVFLGVWRPRLAMPAGLVILTLTAATVLAQTTAVNTALIDWLDWRSVLAHAGGAYFVPVVGAVLVCASLASRITRRPAR